MAGGYAFEGENGPKVKIRSGKEGNLSYTPLFYPRHTNLLYTIKVMFPKFAYMNVE